jgi:hypothetical protein
MVYLGVSSGGNALRHAKKFGFLEALYGSPIT